MIKRQTISTLLPLILVLSSACGVLDKKGDDTKKSKNKNAYQDSHNYGKLELTLAEGKTLSKEKQEIFDAVNKREDVSRKAISAAFVNDHREYFNTSKKQDISEKSIWKRIESLRTALSHKEDQNKEKVRYEKRLAKDLDKEVVYNGVATSIVDILETAQMQCSSGTALHTVILRESRNYYDSNPVIIFESGHVLPGYMVKKKDGFHLVGVETTVFGEGRIEYGLQKEMRDVQLVVDAELFILLELFKHDIKDPKAVAVKMITETAKKYGIELHEHFAVNLANGKPGIAGNQPNLNSSPFSFGTFDMEDKVKQRIKKDKLERGEGRVPAALPQIIPIDVAPTNGKFCKPGSEWIEVPELKACMDPETRRTFSQPVAFDPELGRVIETDQSAEEYCRSLPKISEVRWDNGWFVLDPHRYSGDFDVIIENVNGLEDSDFLGVGSQNFKKLACILYLQGLSPEAYF